MATIEERVYQGSRAKEVLDNESFQWAINAIKDEVKTAWEQSPARDCEGREKLWMMLSLANKLELSLKSMMETGQMAELDLQHKRSLADRVKDAMY